MGQMVAMENPTCIARLMQFKVVAVATQPRLHHIQHLNEVTVGRVCSVRHQRKMAATCGSDQPVNREIAPTKILRNKTKPDMIP